MGKQCDELALYALSDLTKQHTVVITSTKPWSTVHPDVTLKDIYELMNVCDVKLLFLGGNKFGRLRSRPLNYETPIIVNLPVFPGAETPNDHEMERAYSLLMNTQGPKSANADSGHLELQEPTVEPRAAHCEEVNLNLPDQTGMLGSLPVDHTADKFSDTMEHVVGHVLSSNMPKPLDVPDAVDSLCANSVLVETADAKKHGVCLSETSN